MLLIIGTCCAAGMGAAGAEHPALIGYEYLTGTGEYSSHQVYAGKKFSVGSESSVYPSISLSHDSYYDFLTALTVKCTKSLQNNFSISGLLALSSGRLSEDGSGASSTSLGILASKEINDESTAGIQYKYTSGSVYSVINGIQPGRSSNSKKGNAPAISEANHSGFSSNVLALKLDTDLGGYIENMSSLVELSFLSDSNSATAGSCMLELTYQLKKVFISSKITYTNSSIEGNAGYFGFGIGKML